MLLEISEVTPEIMKGQSQSKTTPSCGCDCDRSKVQYCQEQYCTGAWNIRSMNQGKLEVVKQETARVNVNILGISENGLEWVNLTQMTIYIYCCGQESLREME